MIGQLSRMRHWSEGKWTVIVSTSLSNTPQGGVATTLMINLRQCRGT
jgi:hypothetical protein